MILDGVPPVSGRRVVTEGLRVFVGDGGRDHADVRDAQLLAVDLEPFLCRMQAIKPEAVRRR